MLLAQVLNALGDLVIRRLDEGDEESYLDKIDVGLKFTTKQRIIYDMTNTNQHIQLPTMCINIANIQYDQQRAFNKIMGFTVSDQFLSGGGRFPQPVPIKLSLNFSILSRYQRDLDQIITCIFSNFYPYIVISYRHPDLNIEVRCVVMWDGNINFSYPIDAPATQSYRIGADSQFTVMGWIYKNANNPWGVIYNIPTTFTAASALVDDYLTMSDYESPTTTDYKVVSGRPQVNKIDPYFGNIGVSSVQYNIFGDMFQFVTNLAVSAEPLSVYPLSNYRFINPYVSSHSQSAVYPGFTAIQIASADWMFVNDHQITLKLPEPLNLGFVDIIAYGPIGYGRLTEDSIRPTLNPYPTASPYFSSYVEFQYPYVSGVEIR